MRHYIIIANGSRVEDHSKDFINIKESKLRIDNVLTHYKKKNGNYIIKTFLMDADAPIVEDAKLFAKYIDILADRDNTSSINIINLSKLKFFSPKYIINISPIPSIILSIAFLTERCDL